MYCYIKFSAVGIYTVNSTSCLYNIINQCTIGISITSTAYYNSLFDSNTIYNCDDGIKTVATIYPLAIINNIITNCDRGFNCNNSGTPKQTIFFDYNDWYSNIIDISWDNGSSEDNSTKGIHDMDVYPNFVYPEGEDFRLKSSSGLLYQGANLTAGV